MFGHAAEERTELDGYWNVNRDLDSADDVNIGLLYFRTGEVSVCRNEIDIALDGVSAGLLNPLGMINPTTQGRTIEARNDRNLDCFLSFSDVI
jgi:hypothetical protein